MRQLEAEGDGPHESQYAMRLVAARCGDEIAAMVVPAEVMELIVEAIEGLQARIAALTLTAGGPSEKGPGRAEGPLAGLLWGRADIESAPRPLDPPLEPAFPARASRDGAKKEPRLVRPGQGMT
jgi:hypothetical protein